MSHIFYNRALFWGHIILYIFKKVAIDSETNSILARKQNFQFTM